MHSLLTFSIADTLDPSTHVSATTPSCTAVDNGTCLRDWDPKSVLDEHFDGVTPTADA